MEWGDYSKQNITGIFWLKVYVQNVTHGEHDFMTKILYNLP